MHCQIGVRRAQHRVACTWASLASDSRIIPRAPVVPLHWHVLKGGAKHCTQHLRWQGEQTLGVVEEEPRRSPRSTLRQVLCRCLVRALARTFAMPQQRWPLLASIKMDWPHLSAPMARRAVNALLDRHAVGHVTKVPVARKWIRGAVDNSGQRGSLWS